MSTITVSNVSDGTLSIPTTFVTNGSAKAWVNFDGGGTVAIRDSFNVASLTDNGAGDYTTNLTNAMSNDDYMVPYSRGNDGSDVAGNEVFGLRALATGSVRVQIKNTSGTLIDNNTVTTAVIGDLA
jgi:hypothetical protein